MEDGRCDVCATTIIFFLSADNTTLAISKNDRNSNIFDEVTFRKMLKVKHKNVFILQLDLDKNKTQF